MPLFPYNPQMYKEQANLESLAPGWYPAIIIESDVLETNAKDGFRLELKFKVIDGPGKDRTITNNYNIQNPNPKAVEIAMSQIKSICSCIGKFSPINQSEELHNIPLQIRLAKQKDSDYSEVKGYKDINGNDPGKGGQGAPVGHQQQPPQGFGNAPQAQPPYAPPQQQYTPAQGQYAPPVGAQPPAYAPPQPQYAPQTQAPAAAPAWTPPAPQAAAPAYQPPPQQQQQQQAPAWQPGGPQPQAPAWAPQR